MPCQYIADFCSENNRLRIEKTKINGDLSKAMKDKYDTIIESSIKQVQIDRLKENAKNCSTACKQLNTKNYNTANKLNATALEKKVLESQVKKLSSLLEDYNQALRNNSLLQLQLDNVPEKYA